MRFILSLLALLVAGTAALAQTITVPNYLNGLGTAAPPTGSELFYMLQNGASKKATGSAAVQGALSSMGAYYVDLYGAVGNGTTDDAAAFTAAFTACTAGGGGSVVVGPKRYLINSANISIPTRCQLVCPEPVQVPVNTGTNYSTLKYAIIVNPAFTVKFNLSSGTSGCSFVQKNVASLTPTTTRDFLNLQAAFAGNGLTLTVHSGTDVSISNTFIGGFTWGIISEGETPGSVVPLAGAAISNRIRLDHLHIDATNCAWLDNSFDLSAYNTVACFPYMSSGNDGATLVAYTITGIANNGAGLYRVTCSAACASNVGTSNLIQTGDIVVIDGSAMVGAQSTRSNRWVATFVDATHIDLQGSSAVAKVITGTTKAANAGVITLSSTTNIGSKNFVGTDAGPTITDSAGSIPAGTKVASVAPGSSGLVLSANATAGTVGDTLTITDTAWASGGTIRVSAQARRGIGFYFTNTDFFSCTFCFVYGHDVGFRLGDSVDTFDCLNCFTDNGGGDPTTISVWISGVGSTQGIHFNGGRLGQQGQVIRAAGPAGGYANSFMGLSFGNNGNAVAVPIEFVKGNNILVGTSNALTIPRFLWINSLVNSYNQAANNTGMTTVDVR
jgi:hypothetical protein